MKALMRIKEILIGYERIAKSPTYATIFFLVISQLVAWLSFFAVKPNVKLSLFFGVLLAGFVVMPVYYTTRLALLKGAVGWQLAALLANSFIQVVLYFAAVYFAYGTAGNFNAPISRIDAIYFSLGMLTTAGTGSLTPMSEIAREVASIQMLVDFIFVAITVVIAISLLREKWSK